MNNFHSRYVVSNIQDVQFLFEMREIRLRLVRFHSSCVISFELCVFQLRSAFTFDIDLVLVQAFIASFPGIHVSL